MNQPELFPPGTFEKIREAYMLKALVEEQKKNEHLKHVVSGYMGFVERNRRKKR